MKTTLRLLLLLMACSVHSQTVQWAENSPGSLNGENHTIATDSQGNIYSVGAYTTSPQDLDPGAGVYNLSAFSQNMFILKLDPAGNFIWAKQIGGTTNYAITEADAITIDATNNIYFSGKLNLVFGAIDCDPGAATYNLTVPTNKSVDFIEKLDANGNFVWVKTFVNPTVASSGLFDEVQSLKVDSTGNVYATGSFTGTPDFDPNAGVFNLTASKVDIFVLKLDSAGNLVWAKSMPYTGTGTGSVIDSGYGIDVDTSGNVYTVGYYWGAIDADPGAAVHTLTAFVSNNPVQSGSNSLYVSKLDSAGNFVWAYSIDGDHNNGMHPSIVVDNLQNIIVSGYVEGSVAATGAIADFDFGPGTYFLPSTTGSFVLKIDANASFIWAKSTVQSTTTTLTTSHGNGIALDALGNIYTVGGFMGTCDFDPSTSSSVLTASNLDVYVSKLDTNGNFVWANKIGGTGVEDAYSIAVAPSGQTIIWGSVTSGGFTKSTSAVSVGGFLAAFSQPALGVNQNEISETQLYPNPTTGILNLELAKTINTGGIKIISITGQVVFQKEALSGKNFDFDLSFLSSGVYVVEVHDENSVVNTKFIKQ